MEFDAQTMAYWNIDYLKLDGCNFKVERFSDWYSKNSFEKNSLIN